MRELLRLRFAPIFHDGIVGHFLYSECRLHPNHIRSEKGFLFFARNFDALRMAGQGCSVGPPPTKEHPARGEEGFRAMVREIPHSGLKR